MLVGVSNGLGLTTQFTYRSSHALAVDAARAGEPWQYFVPMAMPVPTQQIGALGLGETTRRVTYSVRDGVWDADERRFAGFLSSIVTTWGATPAETASVLTRYNLGLGDKRVLRGKPINEQIRDGTGKRLRLTFNTWEAAPVAGLPDAPLLRVPELTVVQTRYEDGPVLRESKIEYQFDGVGRPVKTFNHGRLDLTGDEAYNETVYGDDAVTGVRSRVVEEIVRTMTYNASGVGQPGELVSRVRHLYGDDSALLPVGVIGKGWERETWAYLAEGSAGRWVRRTRTDYDPHGNAITTINAGVTRQITYDALGLHPVAESLPVGGRTLVWRSDWDNVLGVPTAITDPNGIVNHMRYDALGRVSGISTGAAPEHIVYAYDWSAPFPKTYSYASDGASAELTAFNGWTSGGKWRESVKVSNGRGETRYSAVRLADSQWIIADYRERDPNSRVTFVGEPIYASSVDLTGRPSGMVGQTLVYDPLGRIVREELANGSKRIYTRSVFEELVQQDDLAPVRNILDGQGRIVRTTRAAEPTDATYDAAGRITSFSVDGGRAQHVFRYDTLGNMVFANDPDIGPRTLRYDDRGLLVQTTNGANQSTTYVYDEANRLIERHGSDAAVFRYHYDAVRSQWDGTNVASRLSWVEEPTGSVDLSYDAFGNTVRSRRQIDSKVAEATSTFSPSGLLLRQQYDDGFDLAYKYDRAGRATAAGDLWTLVDQDAAGRVLEERFGNGVTQTSRRDMVGQISGTKVVGAGGATLYDVDVDRLLWGGISHVVDRDSVGLDHTATFSYDGSSRLTGAALGQGASAFKFSYNYDGLENMVRRDVAAPTVVGVLAGEYRYAEHGAGPRQLTSIAGPSSMLHSFAYDGAGRQIAQDGIALTYDGLDQLVRVDGVESGTVQHAYGYDGLRIKTIEPTGQTTYWFAGGLSERNGVREHQVAIGDRTIARVARAEVATPISHARALGVITTILRLLPFAIGALLLLIGASRPRRRYARMFAALTAAATLIPGCTGGSVGQRQQAVWATRDVVYFHQTVSAGPTLFTNADGALLEERRYEPFGESLDAYRKTDTGYVTDAVDFSDLDTNILNKQTDAATGWSYHGARWMAPETGRWLTPDPPVKAPDPQFMQEPWTLHPYQYVQQNPLLYWDPDGRDGSSVGPSPSRRPQPDQFILGNAAHKAIQDYYRMMHRGEVVFTDKTVGGILATVDHPGWLALGSLRQRPDIYNYTTGEVYEIKSMWNWSYAQATGELYSHYMAQFGLPTMLGSPLDPGVHGFTVTTSGRFIDFYSPAPGVILYQEVIPRPVPVPEPVPAEAAEPASIRPRVERAAIITTGVVVGGVVAYKAAKAVGAFFLCGPVCSGLSLAF
jgi:RHS repeat-associated protein